MGGGVQLAEVLVPVAAISLDVMKMRGWMLSRWCMAKAVRLFTGFL